MISPAFKKEFKVDPGKTIIYVRGGKGVIKAVTSSPRALEGPRPSFCVLNETHHWLQNNEGIEMARVIRRNLGKARDGAGRSLEITNAHKPGEGSVAEATYVAVEERGEIAGVWYDSLEAPEVKVHGPGLDQDAIAGFGRYSVQQGLDAAGTDRVRELVPTDSLLQSCVDETSRSASRITQVSVLPLSFASRRPLASSGWT